MRTTTSKRRSLIAYELDESSDEIAVNILGIFAAGQNWEYSLRMDEGASESG